MTIDELARHLDDRLDRAESDRRETFRRLGKVEVALGQVATLSDAADRDRSKIREEVRDSLKSRDARLDKVEGNHRWAALGIIGAAGLAAWNRVFGT